MAMAAAPAAMSAVTGWASHVMKQRRPWAEMVDSTAFSRPENVSEATTRIRRNIAYFKVNYTVMVLAVMLVTMLLNPSSIIWLALLASTWGYLFIVRTEPLVISGRTLSDREKLLGMSGLSLLVIFFLSNVASVVIYGLGIGISLVGLHGALRAPDVTFLEDGQEPGGAAGGSFFSFLSPPPAVGVPAGV